MFRVNGTPVRIERYPDGTLRLVIDEIPEEFNAERLYEYGKDEIADEITIEWIYENDEEMTLFFIARHLRERYAYRDIALYMPYIPYARMDRVYDEDEVFTLKYFCDLINVLGFSKVTVRDAHSPVSLGMLNNVTEEPVDGVINELIDELLDREKDIVFYPDNGSRNRYSGMIDFPHAYGVKERDRITGTIMRHEVRGDIPAAPFNVLIIDDISSYGGTFLHSATKLKELGADKIYLYVTHCENSILKGELINSGLIEKIYTTRSIYTGDHPLIEVIDGDEI
jgi:ribose-phosphate pyrophosphokinase